MRLSFRIDTSLSCGCFVERRILSIPDTFWGSKPIGCHIHSQAHAFNWKLQLDNNDERQLPQNQQNICKHTTEIITIDKVHFRGNVSLLLVDSDDEDYEREASEDEDAFKANCNVGKYNIAIDNNHTRSHSCTLSRLLNNPTDTESSSITLKYPKEPACLLTPVPTNTIFEQKRIELSSQINSNNKSISRVFYITRFPSQAALLDYRRNNGKSDDRKEDKNILDSAIRVTSIEFKCNARILEALFDENSFIPTFPLGKESPLSDAFIENRVRKKDKSVHICFQCSLEGFYDDLRMDDEFIFWIYDDFDKDVDGDKYSTICPRHQHYPFEQKSSIFVEEAKVEEKVFETDIKLTRIEESYDHSIDGNCHHENIKQIINDDNHIVANNHQTSRKQKRKEHCD